MDPFTQGVLGASLPQTISAKWSRGYKYRVALAGLLGMVGGMAADLDVLISSVTDPLFFLTYHRHFTHSLIFIPFGGFMVAVLMHWVLGRRWQIKFWQTVLFCSLGYATHALLDSATSYGTMLLWPFVETRYSFSIISIIDPLFTVPLTLFVVLASISNNACLARIGLIWALIYLSAGWWQHQRARDIAADLAASRGHTTDRLQVKPSFGNILVWKSVYEAEGKFFIDALRVGIKPRTYEGTFIPKLDISQDLPWLGRGSQQARDVTRFNFFSNGFTALDPTNSNRIIDVRYSFVPNEVSALFSLELAPEAGPTTHARYQTHREQAREKFSRLWRMLINQSP